MSFSSVFSDVLQFLESESERVRVRERERERERVREIWSVKSSTELVKTVREMT